MKILKDSVMDMSEELNDFFKSFHGCNYVVYGDLVLFSYIGKEENFNIDSLKDIYFDLPTKESLDLNKSSSRYQYIDGIIEPSLWSTCEERINTCLKCTAEGEGSGYDSNMGLNVVSDSEHKKRKEFFWNIIQKNFQPPPFFVYQHEACGFSYFGFYVMWGFTYILLKNGRGIVLHAGASD